MNNVTPERNFPDITDDKKIDEIMQIAERFTIQSCVLLSMKIRFVSGKRIRINRYLIQQMNLKDA